MAPRETENNAYAKFWVYKQRALWYFWSGQSLGLRFGSCGLFVSNTLPKCIDREGLGRRHTRTGQELDIH